MPIGVYTRKPGVPLKELFEAKYQLNQETGCWDWTAYTTSTGYGQLRVGGKTAKAHRFSYELYAGPIPKGLFVLHRCIGNRKCVNPAHLYIGTAADNTADKVAQGRQSRAGPKVSAKGSEVGNSKLNELQIEEIRELYALGNYTQKYLGSMFGVSFQHISDIVNRKAWGHL